ncbi:signal transduction histidine kinase [Saccharothrix tamanrassetensis]|uniref:histidine kinase n=1 Tax=Saccharothrix tamanrassetensis TaxID=1051531 RepID=A0A841CJF1_9PSEU|nr:histidine kinase [Saccharothrix tamanrassetensis]MBB5957190.1 signal transduction histidine kinase [Saccharothrix tamanrassetensis]
MAARPQAGRAHLERLSDGLLTLLPLMVALLTILNGPAERHTWGLLAVAAAQTAALAWCRRFPLAVLLAVIGLETLLIVIESEIFVGFLVAAWSLGAWGKPLQQRIGLVIGLALLTIGLVLSISGGSPPGLALAGISSVAVMFVGFLVNGRLGARQRTRIDQLEAERAEAEQRAAERERALLARELHDILNHSVTTMVLDATAAAETGSPDEAREALTRVAQTGRNSLAELRRLLGVLRTNASAADHDPLVVPPGLDRIDALVESIPGPRIDLVRSGTAGPLDVSIEHTAYRVVQEALTNVLKHAGAVATTVSLSFTAEQLSVAVVNEKSVAAPDPGTGMGLIGMRERVSLVGGTLTAGPRADGGFEVRAVLPARSVTCSG